MCVVGNLQIKMHILGYYEQLGTGQICSLYLGFEITGLIYVVKWSLGTKTFVHYNRMFVITEFVITEFHCSYNFKSNFDLPTHPDP